MKVINLAETNSILNQFVAELRDVNVQNDRMRFRRNIERIGELMAYEISKTLDYSTKKVQTPLGVAEANTPDDKIVIATVFRAGLPMHTGFLNIFDKAGMPLFRLTDIIKTRSIEILMSELNISLLLTLPIKPFCW